MQGLGYEKGKDYAVKNGNVVPKELEEPLGETQQQNLLRTVAFLQEARLRSCQAHTTNAKCYIDCTL